MSEPVAISFPGGPLLRRMLCNITSIWDRILADNTDVIPRPFNQIAAKAFPFHRPTYLNGGCCAHRMVME